MSLYSRILYGNPLGSTVSPTIVTPVNGEGSGGTANV